MTIEDLILIGVKEEDTNLVMITVLNYVKLDFVRMCIKLKFSEQKYIIKQLQTNDSIYKANGGYYVNWSKCTTSEGGEIQQIIDDFNKLMALRGII